LRKTLITCEELDRGRHRRVAIKQEIGDDIIGRAHFRIDGPNTLSTPADPLLPLVETLSFWFLVVHLVSFLPGREFCLLGVAGKSLVCRHGFWTKRTLFAATAAAASTTIITVSVHARGDKKSSWSRTVGREGDPFVATGVGQTRTKCIHTSCHGSVVLDVAIRDDSCLGSKPTPPPLFPRSYEKESPS
jgi:hypothetical protein